MRAGCHKAIFANGGNFSPNATRLGGLSWDSAGLGSSFLDHALGPNWDSAGGTWDPPHAETDVRQTNWGTKPLEVCVGCSIARRSAQLDEMELPPSSPVPTSVLPRLWLMGACPRYVAVLYMMGAVWLNETNVHASTTQRQRTAAAAAGSQQTADSRPPRASTATPLPTCLRRRKTRSSTSSCCSLS